MGAPQDDPTELAALAADTASVSLCVAEFDAASVTFAVSGYDPARAVIPVMTPLEFCRWIPDGRPPVARLQW